MNIKNIDWKLISLWMAILPGMIVASDDLFNIWNFYIIEVSIALIIQILGIASYFFLVRRSKE